MENRRRTRPGQERRTRDSPAEHSWTLSGSTAQRPASCDQVLARTPARKAGPAGYEVSRQEGAEPGQLLGRQHRPRTRFRDQWHWAASS